MRKIGQICKTKKFMCISIKKDKKELNEKNVTDNQKLWKTVKPMLSNKFVDSEKITLKKSY